MGRIYNILSIFVLLIGLSACAKAQPTWQEQYDLGVRYLSEGNYEEAIIAFTAAIEIDPKQAPAYVGRGDAYVLSGETEENLTAAQLDYEKAIELEETLVEAYLGLVNVYIRQGDYDKALEILKFGMKMTSNNQVIIEKYSEIEQQALSSQSENRVTDFIKRKDYCPFEELTFEEQELIGLLVEYVEENNKQELIKVTENLILGLRTYTLFNQYKVQINCHTSSRGGKVDNDIDIEIRPDSGVGYYCSISVATDLSRYAIPDDSVRAEYYIYGYGQCENWQWNGVITGTDQRIVYKQDGTASYSESNSTGDIVNSLRVNTTTTTEVIYNIDKNGAMTEAIRSVITGKYDNGKLLSEVHETYHDEALQRSEYEGRDDILDSAWTSHSYSLDQQERFWW